MSFFSSSMKVSVMFTRDDDVLDVFVGVVCDVDVHFDGLTVVVHLETMQSELSTYDLFIFLTTRWVI